MAKIQQWEYKRFYAGLGEQYEGSEDSFEGELNAMGDEGWELVSILTEIDPEDDEKLSIFYFKRPKHETKSKSSRNKKRA